MAWSPLEYFQSHLLHSLNIANWQRTEDGRKGRKPPAEIKPPEYAHTLEAKQERLESKVEKYLRRKQNSKALKRPEPRHKPARAPR